MAQIQNFQAALEQFNARRREIFYAKTDLDLTTTQILKLKKQNDLQAVGATPHVTAASEKIFGSPPLKVEWFQGHGTFHSLFKIVLPDSIWILRANFISANMAFELWMDAQIHSSLASPELPLLPGARTDLTRSILPFDFEILPMAPGESLKIFEDSETQQMPAGLLGELGKALANIHQHETNGFGLLKVVEVAPPDGRFDGVLKTWSDYIFLNLPSHLQICQDIGAISTIEKTAILEKFESARPLLGSRPSRLLHGDPGYHNFFAEAPIFPYPKESKFRIAAIIDWEDALAGDPIFDLAYWGTFTRDQWREPLLAGYQTVAALPDKFEYLYWLYYLRIAISKTVHRHLFAIADRAGRPPASQRIQKALEKVEAKRKPN